MLIMLCTWYITKERMAIRNEINEHFTHSVARKFDLVLSHVETCHFYFKPLHLAVRQGIGFNQHVFTRESSVGHHDTRDFVVVLGKRARGPSGKTLFSVPGTVAVCTRQHGRPMLCVSTTRCVAIILSAVREGKDVAGACARWGGDGGGGGVVKGKGTVV